MNQYDYCMNRVATKKFLNNLSVSKEIYTFAPSLYQEWRISPPTGLYRIVGSGGKRMRVRMFNSLKINDYGNQED